MDEEDKKYWNNIKEILNTDNTLEEIKEFVENIEKRIEIFGTPFVCNKCIIDYKQCEVAQSKDDKRFPHLADGLGRRSHEI